MPPPYLVDIDGHPHPLKGQQGILELIRPPLKLNSNKEKEEADVIVDYDEFMKQRQVQLAANKKQLAKVDMNCLLKTGKNNRASQNDRDITNGDQPCCSSSASSQLFSQSQENNIAMETSQVDSNTSVINCKTESVNSMKDIPAITTNTAYKNSLSNGDTTPVQTAVNGFNSEYGTVNGHSVINSKEHCQNSKNSDQNISFDQNGLLNSQEVIKDQALVNFSTNFVKSQKQLDNDQATISDQATINNRVAANDQAAVKNQATINCNDQKPVNHQAVVNTQAVVNNQMAINDQTAVNDQAAVNDQVAIDDQAVVNNQLNGQAAQVAVNEQEVVNNQVAVNDQAAVDGQAAVNDQVAVNNEAVVDGQAAINDQSINDEINIIEFDNSDDAGVGNNNNLLSSIVWSCGLSDEEAKHAVTMWSSRTVIPHLDSEVYGLVVLSIWLILMRTVLLFSRGNFPLFPAFQGENFHESSQIVRSTH